MLKFEFRLNIKKRFKIEIYGKYWDYWTSKIIRLLR